ncbi:MAG TPA: hypothetical protein VMU35_09920, partial [Methylomirabilota bacterium]|nr:hypothetical protein [Methylomirabilota bacterium]
VLLALVLATSATVGIAYASPRVQPSQVGPPPFLCFSSTNPSFAFWSQMPCNPNPTGDHGGPPNHHP